MAVVANRVTLPPGQWVDLTPGIVSSEATFINVSDPYPEGHTDRGIEIRVQPTQPGSGESGAPYLVNQGFEKATLADKTFASGALHVWARMIGTFNGTAYVEFIDGN